MDAINTPSTGHGMAFVLLSIFFNLASRIFEEFSQNMTQISGLICIICAILGVWLNFLNYLRNKKIDKNKKDQA